MRFVHMHFYVQSDRFFNRRIGVPLPIVRPCWSNCLALLPLLLLLPRLVVVLLPSNGASRSRAERVPDRTRNKNGSHTSGTSCGNTPRSARCRSCTRDRSARFHECTGEPPRRFHRIGCRKRSTDTWPRRPFWVRPKPFCIFDKISESIGDGSGSGGSISCESL